MVVELWVLVVISSYCVLWAIVYAGKVNYDPAMDTVAAIGTVVIASAAGLTLALGRLAFYVGTPRDWALSVVATTSPALIAYCVAYYRAVEFMRREQKQKAAQFDAAYARTR